MNTLNTSTGASPLFIASQNGHLGSLSFPPSPPPSLSSLYPHTEIEGLLLDDRAKVDAKNGGVTPLHEACEKGSVEIVNMLIEHGVNVNTPNYITGALPLFIALQHEHLGSISPPPPSLSSLYPHTEIVGREVWK